MSSASSDIVVVGGGLAGLVAAATAADLGRSVTLFDPHPVGGRARTTDRAGWHLNQGAHALYRGGALARFLAHAGVTVRGGDPATFTSYGWRDGRLGVLPTGAGSILRSPLLGTKAKLRFARLFAGLGRLDPVGLSGRSLRDWLAGEPDDVVDVVEALVRTTTFVEAPQVIDAGAVVAQLQLAVDGVIYLDGGWQQIVDALEQRVVRSGVDVRHDEVTAIESEKTGTLVRTLDHLHRCDAVVLAAGGPEVEARLTGAVGPDIGPRVEAACLDLLLDRPAPRAGAFGIRTPHYITPHSAVATLAPDGCGLMSGVHYLASHEAPGEPAAEQAAILRLAHSLGVEDSSIVDRRYLHRVTVSHSMPTAARGGLAGRPATSTDLAAVFRAGDWVGPVGFLADASAASAIDAGRRAGARCARISS